MYRGGERANRDRMRVMTHVTSVSSSPILFDWPPEPKLGKCEQGHIHSEMRTVVGSVHS